MRHLGTNLVSTYHERWHLSDAFVGFLRQAASVQRAPLDKAIVTLDIRGAGDA